MTHSSLFSGIGGFELGAEMVGIPTLWNCEIEKFQIMFMSMGEPFLNYNNLESSIQYLNKIYPNAQLLVSTSAPTGQTHSFFNRFIELAKNINQVGIQFSVHESTNEAREKLIPTSTTSLEGIEVLGERFAMSTGRKPFFNYCVNDKNCFEQNVCELLENFDPDIWECTLSVICEKENTIKNAINEKLSLINYFSERMQKTGYSIRTFNPAGQDDHRGWVRSAMVFSRVDC